MTAKLDNVFADTSFWIALVIKQDQFHNAARQWSQRVGGRIVTTTAVLLETANALSRPKWRNHAVDVINRIQQRSDVQVLALSAELWQEAWQFYCQRPDKAWSMTDCISFVVMQTEQLTNAMTADEHFRQAGFRAVLLEL
ncbi:MAG TPA: PIN domain-containing protein [Pirellulales bacterium]|jgi:hypothetical protein|nr:PIN domain-containing protein [Pirellulales bacterium]